MDAGELSLWEAEYRIQPWGAEREDWRAGVVAHAAEAAMNGDKARDPEDFFPHMKPDREAVEAQTVEEQIEAARRIFGG